MSVYRPPRREGQSDDPAPTEAQRTRQTYIRRVLIAVGTVTTVALLLLVLWYGTEVLLLLFAGLLLAVFLRGLSDWVSSHTPLSSGWALGAVLVTILALAALGVWLLLPIVMQQVNQLAQALPQGTDQLRQRVAQLPFGQQLLAQAPQAQQLMPRSTNVLARTTGIFSSVLGVLTNVVIIVVIGIYFAAAPQLYQRGLVHLVPRSTRNRAQEVLATLGYTLRHWLLGRIAIMAANGALSALALWFLGVPLPVLNGILTGLLNFIPNIGPLLAAIPAVLLAFTQGPTQALYVVGLYILIQNLEGFVLTPLVQQRTVDLPPVLILAAQVLLGILFGFFGVLLAVPITAVVFVLVKMLYVQDVLGEQIEVKGEQQAQQHQT